MTMHIDISDDDDMGNHLQGNNEPNDVRLQPRKLSDKVQQEHCKG